MQKYRCISRNEKNCRSFDRKFLKLPSELYGRNEITQSKSTEKQILNGTHVLSSMFRIFPFMVLNEKTKPVCRCILTVYNEDENAYLGFFEAYDDFEAVRLMNDEVTKLCLSLGRHVITGPVDCSFWIKYRMIFSGSLVFRLFLEQLGINKNICQRRICPM